MNGSVSSLEQGNMSNIVYLVNQPTHSHRTTTPLTPTGLPHPSLPPVVPLHPYTHQLTTTTLDNLHLATCNQRNALAGYGEAVNHYKMYNL